MTQNSSGCFLLGFLFFWVLGGACVPVPSPVIHTSFYRRIPRTILVLPPVNETAELEASDLYLSTITAVLAEHGYYVPPVALVKEMLLSNGLPLPPQMHRAPLDRLASVFGADAVLYVTIHHWGATVGGVRVTLGYRLVDVRDGSELWSRRVSEFRSYSNNKSESLGELVISLLISTVVAQLSDVPLDLVRQANYRAVGTSAERLLLGPYHPRYGDQQTRLGGAPASEP